MIRKFSSRAVWITTASVVAAAVPAAAEVYLNEAQALAAILGENAQIRREQKRLDPEIRAKLERSGNLQFPEQSYAFFISVKDGKPERYAIELNEIGKSEPITFMVGMSPDGKVTDVVVMVFRENRGWEVQEKRFLNQFRGKTLRNSIRVNEDIINYTGATLSSKALARGVRRALLLLDAFYPAAERTRAIAANELVRPAPLAAFFWTSTAVGEIGLYRQSRYGMGSVCEIRAWCRSGQDALRAFDAGFAEIRRLEQIFSAHRDDSELAHVNRAAANGPVRASADFCDLTHKAMQLHKQTGGASDPTVAPLIRLWGISQGQPHIPSETELMAIRKCIGCDKLLLDERERTIRFRRGGMELDFGGLAKGYAAERAVHVVAASGARSALVDLGRSSLATSGRDFEEARDGIDEWQPSPGLWLVGVVDPSGSLQYPAYLWLKAGSALSTSGTGEQQFELAGQRFSHILDPRTGFPLEGIRSATVIAQSGVETEALAKCLLMNVPSTDANAARCFAKHDYVLLEARDK
jgi:FAD:protein FMN transferase